MQWYTYDIQEARLDDIMVLSGLQFYGSKTNKLHKVDGNNLLVQGDKYNDDGKDISSEINNWCEDQY